MGLWVTLGKSFIIMTRVGNLYRFLVLLYAISTMEDVGKFDKYNIIKIIGNND